MAAAAAAANHGMRIVVGVDGSDGADAAYQVASAILKPKDFLDVFHVFSTSKDKELHRSLKSSAVETKYSTSLSSTVSGTAVRCWKAAADKLPFLQFSPSHAQLNMVESLSTKPRRHKVLAYVNGLHNPKPDFFVVGFSGSKGAKAERGIMGHTTDYSLRGALMSTVVVKGTHLPKRGEPHKYVLGVDGSERSKLAADRIRALAGDSDTIVLLHVYSSTTEGDIGAKFRAPAVKEFFKGYANDDDRCSYAELDCTGDGKHSLADSLVDYALAENADFVGVGCDGVGSYTAGKKETVLGSFSDRVVKMAQLSVVVVQNRDATYGDTAEEADAGKVAHK